MPLGIKVSQDRGIRAGGFGLSESFGVDEGMFLRFLSDVGDAKTHLLDFLIQTR